MARAEHALDGDLEVGAGHADPEDVDGLHLPRFAERLLDDLPVTFRTHRVVFFDTATRDRVLR